MVGRWTEDGLRWLSLGAGVVGLIFAATVVLVDSGVVDPSSTVGHGGVERMIVYPALIWMLFCGGRALAAIRTGVRDEATASVPA